MVKKSIVDSSVLFDAAPLSLKLLCAVHCCSHHPRIDRTASVPFQMMS